MRITLASVLDGVRTLDDRSTHQIKIHNHALHLTFTRAADTVVVANLDNALVVVERLGLHGATRATLTRSRVCTVTNSASVFYYCKQRDDGTLYVDEQAVIMLHYGPYSPRTSGPAHQPRPPSPLYSPQPSPPPSPPPSPRNKYAGQRFEEETDRSVNQKLGRT